MKKLPISSSSTTSSSPKSLSPSPPESYTFDIPMEPASQPHRYHDSLSTVNEATNDEKTPSPNKAVDETSAGVVTPPQITENKSTVNQSRF